MEEAGTKLGLAFQIQDDILDVTSTQEVLGKPIGSDEQNDKATYVAFEGVEASRAEVKRLTEEAVAILDGFVAEHTFLRELFLYLLDRKY
jgi:geranylgeranyl diphosphate synthase type II